MNKENKVVYRITIITIFALVLVCGSLITIVFLQRTEISKWIEGYKQIEKFGPPLPDTQLGKQVEQLSKQVDNVCSYINTTITLIGIIAALIGIAMGLRIWHTRKHASSIVESAIADRRDRLNTLFEEKEKAEKALLEEGKEKVNSLIQGAMKEMGDLTQRAKEEAENLPQEIQAKLDDLFEQASQLTSSLREARERQTEISAEDLRRLLKVSEILFDNNFRVAQEIYRTLLDSKGFSEVKLETALKNRETEHLRLRDMTAYMLASLSSDEDIAFDACQKLSVIGDSSVKDHLVSISDNWRSGSQVRIAIEQAIREIERREESSDQE